MKIVKNTLQKIFQYSSKKKKVVLIAGIISLVVSLVSVYSVSAGGVAAAIGGGLLSVIREALGAILEFYVFLAGFLMIQVTKYLISIAQWNSFVDNTAVVLAWSLVRDIANMILVIILLFIAMATIFGSSKYGYKALLPRLLVMAVAINFSRTIAGLMIDFGQVFMITFVNAWSGAAGGNFVNALKINELLSLNTGDKGFDNVQLIVGYALAGILVTVSLIVLTAFAIILTLRIVTLWMLIVFSPLAFALSAWPSAKASKHYGQWWDKFIDNVVVGPAIAFFLWLTLATIGGGDIASESKQGGALFADSGESTTINGQSTQINEGSPTLAARLDHLASFIIGISMLMASLAMTQEMRQNVLGAGAGQKMLGFAQKQATGLGKKIGKLGLRGAGAGVGYAADKTRVKERAYSALGTMPVLGASPIGRWAQGKAANERVSREKKRTEEASKAKNKTLPELRAGARPPVARGIAATPQGRAEQLANLSELMSTKGTKLIKDDYIKGGMTNEQADVATRKDQQTYLKQAGEAAEASHSPSSIEAISDLKKQRLDLLGDDEVGKIAGGLQYEDAIKLKPPALEKAAKHLPTDVRNKIKEYGSRDQQAALAKGLDDENKAKDLSDGLDRGDRREESITVDEVKIAAITVMLSQDDKKDVRSKVLKNDNKRRALHDTAKTERDKELSAGGSVALVDGRYNDKALKLSETMIVAGGDFKEAYECDEQTGNFARPEAAKSFRSSLQGQNKTDIVLRLNAKTISRNDSNNELAKALTEELKTDDLRDMVAQEKVTPQQRKTIAQIIAAMRKSSDPSVVAKYKEISTDSLLEEEFKKYLPESENEEKPKIILTDRS